MPVGEASVGIAETRVEILVLVEIVIRVADE